MNNKIVIRNREPQEIRISGGGEVVGITTVLVNGIDVTEGSVAYVVVPTKLSELENNMHFISEEVDPTVPYYVKQITQADINKWNNKQDLLVSGTNIKTINGNSIMGSGNLVIDTSYTAGTGIEITEENVINNTITSYNDLTDLPTIPDKTSDLLNDSGYVTSDDLAEVAFTGSYVSLSNTPTVVSDFINDANYVDMSFIWNMLPKLTDIDSTINLTPTILNAPLKLELNPSTLSQDGTPSPNSPESIHSTTGDNTINVCGTNLYIGSQDFSGVWTNSDNWATDDNTYNGLVVKKRTGAWGGLYKEFNAEAGKTYTFSVYIKSDEARQVAIYITGGTASCSPSNSTINDTTSWQRYSITFNCTASGTIRPRVENTSAITGNYTYICGYQLELGNSATDYQPYNKSDYSINLGDIEYCKIGTYSDRIFKNISSDPDYDDTLDVGDWYIKKNIGKIVLDGTEEGWETTATNVFASANSFIVIATANNARHGLSNYYVFNSVMSNVSNTIVNGEFALQYAAGNTGRIFFKNTDISTVDDFKTWLSNNNTTIYYILETPTYTKLSDELATEFETLYTTAKSYNGQTNISQINDDLPFVISAETLKSMVNL